MIMAIAIAIAYKDKLSTRLFSLLIIIFIVLSFYVPSITKGNAIETAIQTENDQK